jgi:membrane protein YdbS with pleckstrin-like domain
MTDADGSGPGADRPVPEWLSLDDGETVEWVGRPAFVSVLSAVLFGIPFLLVFGLGLLIIAGSVLSVRNTDYVATNESLYVRSGVLSTNIESVGLDRVQNTEFRQSFLGTRFGYGTVEISTAGSEGSDVAFRNVESAREVRELLSRLIGAAGATGTTDAAEGTAARDGPGTDELLAELLAELTATREVLERLETRAAGAGEAGGDDGGVPEDRGDDAAEAGGDDGRSPSAEEWGFEFGGSDDR